MKNYLQIAAGLDVLPLVLEINQHPELWDRNDVRLSKAGPHSETHDMWLRYKDETPNKETGNYLDFGDPHDAVWYPAFYALPAARKLIFDLMARVQGERLGGVFIYSVPPGKKIYPHTDPGWHAAYYDKFNICLQSNPKAFFGYDGETMFQRPGDVHRFVNTVDHWVVNEGSDDHIIMCVCIRVHDYAARYRGEETHAMPTDLKLIDFKEKVEFRDGFYRRSLVLKQGQMVGQHMHEFDHKTEITRGRARMWKNGAWAGDHKAGTVLEIKAKSRHAFQALGPDAETEITCLWPEDIDPETAIVKEQACPPPG